MQGDLRTKELLHPREDTRWRAPCRKVALEVERWQADDASEAGAKRAPSPTKTSEEANLSHTPFITYVQKRTAPAPPDPLFASPITKHCTPPPPSARCGTPHRAHRASGGPPPSPAAARALGAVPKGDHRPPRAGLLGGAEAARHVAHVERQLRLGKRPRRRRLATGRRGRATIFVVVAGAIAAGLVGAVGAGERVAAPARAVLGLLELGEGGEGGDLALAWAEARDLSG